MSLSGNLKTVAFPDILQLLSTGKKTGVLEIRTKSRQKEVAFKDGSVIYASSVNSHEDLLGQMLLKRGKISKTDLERAISLHKQTGRQMGTTLVDMNLFDKEEVAICLKLQIEETVYNLFSWSEGDFIFHEGKTPQNASFFIELNTMNVIMEGTRRIDEWLEIQKVLPPDDVLLRLASNPKVNRDELTISIDEFRLLSLINGERTLPELVDLSPMGEFVTYRAMYRLVISKLIEVAGRRDGEQPTEEDEEEVVLRIIFKLYSNCFYRIRDRAEAFLGEENESFVAFASRYRRGLLSYFPGVDPNSDLMPPFEKFAEVVRALSPHIRYHVLMSDLDRMLSGQLIFVYQMLGEGPFKNTMLRVKKEIAEPLAIKREIVKKYKIEDSFYGSLRRAENVVELMRG